MNGTDLKDRLDFAVSAARAAGKHTLRYFQQALVVERKSDQSPVTIADREAEQMLRAAIATAYPDDGILGEELGETAGRSGYRWILDPIDGTKSFICGVPLYSTLVGVEFEGRSELGVIVIPALDECVYAARGSGAWHVREDRSPVPARVSAKSRLSESLFVTSEIQTFIECGRLPVFEKLQTAAWLTRTWGDGYGYFLLATGRAEVMVDPKMFLWDCAALQPIVEEAGGTFTDWNGKPTIYGSEAIGTNSQVLHEVLSLLTPE
jgi:histidinol-phosphatase